MKTYYQLLSVGPAAPGDEIKRAFRREIARYHPDKVQHLGPEFQEIAATRAAELTEAYRILMDPEERQKYDDGLQSGGGQPSAAARQTSAARADPAVRTAHAAPPVSETIPPSVTQTRSVVSDVVKKATLARLRAAVDAVVGAASPLSVAGFDAAYSAGGTAGLFKKGDPPLRLLVRIVPLVDGASVTEAWPLALRAGKPGATLCLLLMGAAVAPATELATAVAELRRKSRNTRPVLVPVDFRDWDALFPPETPPVVRSVIQRLKQGH